MENRMNRNRSASMSTASLVLGIVGVATGCCIYTAVICGALAIIFALLSRGGEMTLDAKAKAGLTLGIIGVVLGILILVFCFAMVSFDYGSFDLYLDSLFEIYDTDYSTYPYTLSLFL